MCRALRAEGVETLIATTDADGSNRLPVLLEQPIPYRGVPTIFFRRDWNEGFKYSHSLALWLKENVRHFDLVHIHAVFSHSSLSAGSACQQHDKPYVVHPLGALDPWCLSQKRMRKMTLWALGVKKLLRGANVIHYTTLEEKRSAEKTLRLSRGRVIPLGVEEDFFGDPSPPENPPYIVTLCRLHPQKGLVLLLEAFLELIQREEFKKWRLVIAGDGNPKYAAQLKRFVAGRDGYQQIIFTGWVEGEQKVSLLRKASLFVLPSYQESFGLSVAEAMACRVPVLISKNVNLAEEIENEKAGKSVALEGRGLLCGLIELLHSETLRTSLGAAGRRLAERRFRWFKVGPAMVNLYQDILNPHHDYVRN